jgi:hypothetical protein
LSSLFEYLCEKNAVTHNPVKGVKRPKAESGEGKTPAPVAVSGARLECHPARKVDDTAIGGGADKLGMTVSLVLLRD